MALVRRFTLPYAVAAGHDVFVQGIGLFAAGVLDIPTANTAAIAAVVSVLTSAGITDTGVVDSATNPTPAVQVGDPYPQYLTSTDFTGAVADGSTDISLALKAAYVPKWKPSTAYASGEFVLNPSGQIVSANTAFTSGTTYSASNWTVVSGGGGGASLPSQTGNARKLLTTDGTNAAWKTAPMIDAADYGVVGDNSTDNTTALQAALNASPYPVSGLTGNDVPARIVQLPPGRIKTGPVTIPPNTWLRGHGPSGTYLVSTTTTGNLLTPAAGAVQVTISDLGIIGNGAATAGASIYFAAGSASILADTRRVVRDVVIVSGWYGINSVAGGTEDRLVRVTVQRPIYRGFDMAATDMFISDCTIGQPGDIGIALAGANTRMWGCKVYGGTNSAKAHYYITGAGRHEVTNCESQDAPGDAFNISTNNPSVIENCLADSCGGYGFNLLVDQGKNRLKNCHTVARSGGAHTPTAGVFVNSTASTVQLSTWGSFPALAGTLSGNEQLEINAERGIQSVNYAASVTVDPYAGGTVYLGTLTGNLTLANPAAADGSPFHHGQTLRLVLTQDATGGRTVTFGSKMLVVGGVNAQANATTILDLAYDPAADRWRQVTSLPTQTGNSGKFLTTDGTAVSWGTPAGGGASAWPGGGPTVKRGVYIPANWGSTWQAAKANHATQLVEAVFFGDSTSYGSCTTAGSEVFSWVSWLRSLSIAAGITDGGRGIVYNDRLDTVADQALPAADSGKAVLSAPTGFTASLPSGAVSPGAVSSNTVNDTITFTGKGTAIRLHYTRNSTTGRFSYSVDGGTAIIVDAYASPTLTAGTIYIGGLTEGTHTLTVVNLGSTAIRPPTTSFPNRTATGGGSLTAGTYYYVVTGTNASGETTASSVITGTSGAGGQITLSMDTLQSGVTGIKVYRTANGSGSSSGPFGLLGTSATNSFTDTGGTAPTMGTNPPGTSTAGLDSSVVLVGINPDFFRSAGVVYYKNATSGISAGSYFGTSTTTLSPNAQVALGLTPGIGGPGGSYDWGTAKLAGPNNRAPALAVWALGINDLQGLTIASEGTPTTTESDTATRQVALVENYVTHFVRMAREAGADPLVIVPHFDLAQHAHTWGGQFAKGVWAAAVANGCAVIDFNEAFRPVGTMVARGLGNPGVHSEVNTYKAEAQFLWDNVLSL